MKFHCPHCRHECDYEEMEMDADLMACIKMLPTYGPHANLVMAYTELFGLRPLKAKRKKWRLLLEEMKRLFDSESFVYNRRRYDIARAGIAEALSVVVHRHWTDHLENHNYLKKIMIGIAEQEGKAAGKQAEQDLKKKEARLMAGKRDESPSLDPSRQGREGKDRYAVHEEQVEPPSRISEEQRQGNLRRLGEIIKGIG